MRVEPHGIGSIVHVIKRGARGSQITRDTQDKDRFVRSLYYLNETTTQQYWHRETLDLSIPDRPAHWPERETLVGILGWTLLPNHFHLLLYEIREGGVAKFMQRLGGSMSAYFNAKYSDQGSLFQGGYRGITVDQQEHLQYLCFYILVKNVFDVYPGGIMAASKDFDNAWAWAIRYPYSSLASLVSGTHLPLIDDPDGLLGEIFKSESSYKKEANDLLSFHLDLKGSEFSAEMLEPW